MAMQIAEQENADMLIVQLAALLHDVDDAKLSPETYETKKIAEENHCYKMMLLTGSKEESTLNFYRNAGYNSSDKTAFIQWIDM